MRSLGWRSGGYFKEEEVYMKVFNLSSVNLKLGLVLLVIFFNQRIALANEGLNGEQVVDQYLSVLKQEVLNDLNTKAEKALSILGCVEDEDCAPAETLLEKYAEYRIYFGLAQYEDLSYRLKQANAGYAVSHGARVYFSLKNSFGVDEWNKIQNLVALDSKEKHRVLAAVNKRSDSREFYRLKRQVSRGSQSFYSSIVSEYLEHYPYFGFIHKEEPKRKDLAEAIVKVGKELEKAIVSVSKLEGDNRLELMGFTTSVENTVDNFSESENTVFANYLNSKNNETRFLGKLLKIVTNVRTIALATCHITTYALAGAPNPVVQIARLSAGFICSSVGLTLTAKYFGLATIDIMRQFQYTKTMQYSSEIWFQNLRSYMITTVMAYLYIIPSLPGLSGRLGGIRSQTQLASRAMRMNKLSLSPRGLLKFNSKRFLNDVKGLGNSYAVYYGEELAIHSVIAMGGRHLSSVTKIESALVGGAVKTMELKPRVYSYSQLLQTI